MYPPDDCAARGESENVGLVLEFVLPALLALGIFGAEEVGAGAFKWLSFCFGFSGVENCSQSETATGAALGADVVPDEVAAPAEFVEFAAPVLPADRRGIISGLVNAGASNNPSFPPSARTCPAY